MATPLIQKLQDDLDSINSTYEARFAGQSRATRELSELDALVTQLRSVLSRVDGIPAAARGPELNTIRDTATQQLDLFQKERVAIQEAKKAGPSLEKFAPLAASANFVFARYAHHYAGKQRNTRDLERLDEMVEDLRKIEDEMVNTLKQHPLEQFRQDLEVVRNNMKMYRDERAEIVKAQATGSLEDQAGLLAQLANDQFEVYRVHFAGMSRATRRPQLLSRVITSLERIQKAMRALEAKNVNADFNKGNIDIVEQNLQMYRTELTEIRKARESTSITDLQGNLGDAANTIFTEYRGNFAGKNRTQVDITLLVNICDKLEEVYRQMRDLGRSKPTEMNTKNLSIVTDQLTLFNREYDQIAQAQGIQLSRPRNEFRG
jgi:hypothetical protein